MGERKARRAKFFGEHPVCCFCGGETKATTEDHQPARVLFKGRAWPEGFVFPACELCNAVSRSSENVVALLLHGEGASEDRTRFQRLVGSIAREFPHLLPSMIPKSANEKRAILRKKGISLPSGMTFGELPLIKLDSEFWNPHFEMFARKLLLAFHYACFKKPLSKSGVIWYFPFSNVDANSGKVPDALFEMTPNIVAPIRHKVALEDQFSVRSTDVADPPTGLFVAQFHRRFMVAGITTEAPDCFDKHDDARAVGPFNHN